MAANQRPVANPVYENFEPSTEWEGEPTAEILNVFLPGFKREQLKVQVTSTHKLRISGERPIENNKWSRFEKELQIPSNCNTNETAAKFVKGTLSIRLPKNIVPAAETQKPTAEAPKPQDQLPKQDLKPEPKPPTENPIPQKPPQEKVVQPPQEKVVQPPQESVRKPQKPTNDQTPQAPENKKKEEAVVQEAAPKTSNDKPKTENNVPKKEAEEKKGSPSDKGKKKSGVHDSINRNPAKIDKPSSTHKDKQVLGGLMAEMKKPKKLMNVVVVVLFIVVIVLYAKGAIRSLVKSNTPKTSSSDYQA